MTEKLARFLPNAEQSKNRAWVTADIESLWRAKDTEEEETWDSGKGQKKVRVINQEIKKITKKGKRESWIDVHCQGTVDNIKNISKKAYQLLKVFTRRKQGQANTIRDKNSNCLAEAQDIPTR